MTDSTPLGCSNAPLAAATVTATLIAPKLGENLIGTAINLPEVRQIALTRSHIIEILLRNVDEARAEKQYGVVRASIVDIAKISGVYVESKAQDIRFKLDQNEDLSSMSEAELQQLLATVKQLSGETIDVEAIAESSALEPVAGILPAESRVEPSSRDPEPDGTF